MDAPLKRLLAFLEATITNIAFVEGRFRRHIGSLFSYEHGSLSTLLSKYFPKKHIAQSDKGRSQATRAAISRIAFAQPPVHIPRGDHHSSPRGGDFSAFEREVALGSLKALLCLEDYRLPWR